MVVSSEGWFAFFEVHSRSNERINYEKQNDLYWENKFTRLRSLVSRGKCALGVKAKPKGKKKSCHILRENYNCEG